MCDASLCESCEYGNKEKVCGFTLFDIDSSRLEYTNKCKYCECFYNYQIGVCQLGLYNPRGCCYKVRGLNE
jgi:hypothetical protein